jgi:hypothetical protein
MHPAASRSIAETNAKHGSNLTRRGNLPTRPSSRSVESDEESVASRGSGHSSQLDARNSIAHRETGTVQRLKYVVALVLVAFTTVAALAVHWYTSHSEVTKFQQQFDSDSIKVLEAIGSSLDKTLGAFESLSVTLVSYADYSNSTWPFVTMPNFGMHVSKILPVANALLVVVLPIVSPSQRLQWEAYAPQHDSCLEESMTLQSQWDQYYGNVSYEWYRGVPVCGIDFAPVPYNVTYVYPRAIHTARLCRHGH